jgi:hypothetical protein
MAVAKPLAYQNKKLIRSVKSFMEEAFRDCTIKLHMAIIVAVSI